MGCLFFSVLQNHLWFAFPLAVAHLALLNRFWANDPFPGPFASVGTPSDNMTGDQAGLPVTGD